MSNFVLLCFIKVTFSIFILIFPRIQFCDHGFLLTLSVSEFVDNFHTIKEKWAKIGLESMVYSYWYILEPRISLESSYHGKNVIFKSISAKIMGILGNSTKVDGFENPCLKIDGFGPPNQTVPKVLCKPHYGNSHLEMGV